MQRVVCQFCKLTASSDVSPGQFLDLVLQNIGFEVVRVLFEKYVF